MGRIDKRKNVDIATKVILFVIGLIIALNNIAAGIVLIVGGLIVSYKEIIGFLTILRESIVKHLKESNQSAANTDRTVLFNAADVNAPVYIITDRITPESLKEIKKKTNIKEVKPEDLKSMKIKEIKEEKIDYKESKKLLDKINSYLDESKPTDNIAEMSLRLCQNLKMDEYLEWLKNEVCGYVSPMDNNVSKMIKRDKSKHPEYRIVNAEFWVGLKGYEDVRQFDLKILISQPISVVGNWIKSAGDSRQLSIRMTPGKDMVDRLKVDPNDKVPLIIQTVSLQNIVTGFRASLNKFLLDAKNEIDKHM